MHRGPRRGTIEPGPGGCAFATLGSVTAGSSYGVDDRVPELIQDNQAPLNDLGSTEDDAHPRPRQLRAHSAPRLPTARTTGHQAALPGEALPRPTQRIAQRSTHRYSPCRRTHLAMPEPKQNRAIQRTDYRYEVASDSGAESAISVLPAGWRG